MLNTSATDDPGADAIITIVIDDFTTPWQPPQPGQQSFTVTNYAPLSFIPVLSPPVQDRITITQPGGGNSGSITISGSGALTIRFKVISGVGATHTRYVETGLIFGLLSSGGRLQRGESPINGRDNFPMFVSDDRGITVRDEDTSDSSYEFVLVIQNAAGGVAVVDPRIINTPS